MDGLLIIDKPAGMTSHDVVARVRRILGERSIGHLGTLDPMATGVLPLLVGRYTRLAQFFNTSEKSYSGTIRFGFSTDTYDAEGEATSDPKPVEFGLEEVRKAAARFLGRIQQMPPQYSAKKIDGVPAYRHARKGQTVELKAAEVEVHQFEIVELTGELATFSARVSAGTYIRTLAHDLGHSLGVGAHLASLRRTASGPFVETEAISLEELGETTAALIDKQCPITDIMSSSTKPAVFLHPREVLSDFPAVAPADDVLAKVSNGIAVNLPVRGTEPLVRVFRGQTELVAICQRVAGTLFRPKVVLAAAGSDKN